MILSDGEIKRLIREGRIVIDPFDENSLDDVSYEVHLADEFLMIDHFETEIIDVKDLSNVKTKKVVTEKLVLQPGDFVIGRTIEWIKLPEDITVLLSGKSSLARLGLQVHAAALIHPRSEGYQIFELFNFGRVPIVLRKGMAVGQFIFIRNTPPEKEKYDWMSRYKGQSSVKMPKKIAFLKEK